MGHRRRAMSEQVAVVAATRSPPRDLEGVDDDPGAPARPSSLSVAGEQEGCDVLLGAAQGASRF